MPYREVDPEIFQLIALERDRQQQSLSLIASENIVSKSVLLAVGSELTNKYAEGYPGRRYYGGCEFHDQVENLAIERAKKIFGVDHANVQPHCGSNANIAAMYSLAKTGDTILAMSLDQGGHLTHGSPVNFSGRFFKVVSYGVTREQETIDYDTVSELALHHEPKIIIAGASAYSRTLDFAQFSKIAKSCGAYLLVDMAHIAGLIAASVHPSPAPYADIITTTTHKTLRGPRGGMILCKDEFKKSVDSWVFPGFQGGPLMHEIAGKAVCFKEAMEPDFVVYQANVIKNARRLAMRLKDNGLRLVSGGTDNHLLLVDLSSVGLTGKEAETSLGDIGIVANKNKIPFDEKPATITSGIRLGTPSITTRGMGEDEMDQIGDIIAMCLKGVGHKSVLREKILQLARKFVA
ncbi:MAG TPA: serine hydroxymethyltransferase [Myxococcota bacterium]|nr:serine hydroxymethyltransferase [Myxococcota bacterium]